MGGRTFITSQGLVAGGIGDMGFVIGAVDVLAVPTRGENDRHANTARAGLRGEVGSIGPITWCAIATHRALRLGQAAVAVDEGTASLGAEGRVSSEHAEALGTISTDTWRATIDSPA